MVYNPERKTEEEERNNHENMKKLLVLLKFLHLVIATMLKLLPFSNIRLIQTEKRIVSVLIIFIFMSEWQFREFYCFARIVVRSNKSI